MKTIDNCKISCLVMATALSIGLGFVTHASAKSYLINVKTGTATDLGDVEAQALNDAGQVAGSSGSHAFITGPNGAGMTDLGTLPGRGTHVRGINDAGQVVGWSEADEEGPPITGYAFITGPNGMGMSSLGRSYVFGINNAGQVVGSTGGHAFITGPNGVGMTDLGSLGGSYSFARGINNAGQVVGESYTGNGYDAFITGPNGVGMIDLGTGEYGLSSATGINDAGQVVGSFYSANNYPEYSHAFITGPNGVGMTDLNSLVQPAGRECNIQRVCH